MQFIIIFCRLTMIRKISKIKIIILVLYLVFPHNTISKETLTVPVIGDNVRLRQKPDLKSNQFFKKPSTNIMTIWLFVFDDRAACEM